MSFPSPSSERLFVCMIVQPNEHNESCQRLLEHQLWNAHGIPLIRATMKQIKDRATIREKDGALILSVHAQTVRAACAASDWLMRDALHM